MAELGMTALMQVASKCDCPVNEWACPAIELKPRHFEGNER